MKCPRCDRPGRRAFKGYCTKVHRDLDAGPKLVQLECAVCGRPVPRSNKQAQKSAKVYCKRCPKNQGETHPNWRNGQYINPAGYRLILVNNVYKLEHRHTWEQANLSCLLPDAVGIVSVHHINMNKQDNRPENLVLLTNAEHGRVHRYMDAERFEEAKSIILENCARYAFFCLNPKQLEALRRTPLEEIIGKHEN